MGRLLRQAKHVREDRGDAREDDAPRRMRELEDELDEIEEEEEEEE